MMIDLRERLQALRAGTVSHEAVASLLPSVLRAQADQLAAAAAGLAAAAADIEAEVGPVTTEALLQVHLQASTADRATKVHDPGLVVDLLLVLLAERLKSEADETG